EISPLDGGDDPLVVGAFLRFDCGDRLGSNTGALAKSLIADDRRQPLATPLALTQSGLAAPGSEQGVLGDVLGLARIAGVPIGNPEANPVRLPPFPTIAGIAASRRDVDFLKVLRPKPDGPT